jgi:hypothetical protein
MEAGGNMPTSSAKFAGKALMKQLLLFIVHQIIGTVGVILGAGLILALTFDVLRLFGHTFPAPDVFHALSDRPYFPVQICFGLLLGWILGWRLGHRAMTWVWIMPSLILLYLFVMLPTTAASFAHDARLSHFFGWGCRVKDHCFDQLGATLPFYTATSYAVGAVLGRKTRARHSGTSFSHA